MMWLRDEEKLKSKINANPKLSKAKQVYAGVTASTADIEEALEDYINDQRKQHRGCGSKEVVNKLLELKPDALSGLPATARPQEALVQHPPAYQRGSKPTHRTRGYGVGDVDEAAQGSRGARW